MVAGIRPVPAKKTITLFVVTADTHAIRQCIMDMITLAERNMVPDRMIRFGIRRLLRQRLRDEQANDAGDRALRDQKLLDELRQSPIAIETDAANEQHYEIPADFYQTVLGKHLKYSACYWNEATDTLDQAEEQMLNLYLERADLADHQEILELGCGWGSLTLWMARRFPHSTITAVSNAGSQRAYILRRAAEQGLTNIEVITCDVNRLSLKQRFDRIVSVEMFEHMRNYENLLARIAGWLEPDGLLFVHIFCHRSLAYPFETEGDNNWMGRYFFTGGLMPARDTLLHFQKDLRLQSQWDLSGTHYQKTAEAWLRKLDRHRSENLPLFVRIYGDKHARLWLQRWRIFFMACAELFGYRSGDEWMVAHYRFARA